MPDKLLTKVSQAAETATGAALWRDQTIRNAVTAGHSQAEVARAAGLTRARVNQIVRKEESQ